MKGRSPREQIESIVRSLETKGVPAAPVGDAMALATSHPKAVSGLAVEVMRRFPNRNMAVAALPTWSRAGWSGGLESARAEAAEVEPRED